MGRKGAESNEERSGSGGKKPYAKYYNRKFIEQKNSIENAFLKFKAMQFYLYLLEAESFLRQTIEILEREKRRNQKNFKL